MGFSFAFLSTCVRFKIGSFVFRSRSGSLLSLLGRLSQHGALRAQRVGQSRNTLRRHTDETASDLASGYATSNVGTQKKKLSPAGIEPGTQRLPAQRPTNSTTPSHRRKSSGLWYETIRWVWVNMGFSRWCGVKWRS